MQILSSVDKWDFKLVLGEIFTGTNIAIVFAPMPFFKNVHSFIFARENYASEYQAVKLRKLAFRNPLFEPFCKCTISLI